MRERHREFGSAQIGPPDRADHQRTTREQRHRHSIDLEQIRVVVQRVTRRRDRRQRDAESQRHLLAVTDRLMWGFEVRCRRRDERDTPASSETGAAGHVVGM